MKFMFLKRQQALLCFMAVVLTTAALLFFTRTNDAFAASRAFSVEGADSRNVSSLKKIISQNLDSGSMGDIQNVVNAIYGTHLYSDIEVYEDEAQKNLLIFKVTQVKHIKTIRFVGNKSFSNSDLLNELSIHEGDVYDSDKVRAGVDNVKKHYNLNGYLAASVIGNLIVAPQSSDIAFEIRINEGAPCLITSLVFKSDNTSLNNRLEKRFSSKLGKQFTQNLLSSMHVDIGEYLFDERYYSATLQPPETSLNGDHTQVTLIYNITNPFMYSLSFDGNDYFSDSRIFKELKLSSANKLSSSPVDDLSDRITRFYKSQGFANVEVTHKEDVDASRFRRKIKFDIKEREKVKIKDIVFNGVFTRPQKYYKEFILDHGGDLLSSKIYNTEELDQGVRNLVTDLQNQGYLGAKVSGLRTEFNENKQKVTIRVNLDEGPQTVVQDIHFIGVSHVTREELEATIGLQENRPLNLSILEQSAARIVQLYQSQGYLDAQVTNSGKSIIDYSQDNTRATLTYHIYEGPQIIVNGIVIEGNDFTKDYVIRRELQFKVGDVLTLDKISYSEQRLQRLSFFSSIDIHPVSDDPLESRRVIIVSVREQNPGVFKSGVGINNDFTMTVKGYAGVDYRNLFGTGRGVNFRGELAYKTQYNFLEDTVTIGYTEPFIFETNNTAHLILLKSRKLLESLSNGQTWATDTDQGDFTLERDLSKQLKVIYDFYGIANMNFFEINGNYIPPSSPTLVDIATLGPTFILDRRNDPFNPSFGDITSLSFEFSHPSMGSSSTVSYYKTTLGYTRYIPMNKVVWANQIKGGYLKNISVAPGSAVPFPKIFNIGGPSTIRGFNPYTESIPLLSELPVSSPYYGLPTESWFDLIKSEIRFPIIGNLGGAVFYDGGQVVFPEFNPLFRWRDSVGLGLHYNTPVGPVSLEYAFKLEVDQNRGGNIAEGVYPIQESPGQLIFNIGVF